MITLRLYLILFTALNIFLYSNAEYIGKTNLQEILKNQVVFTCEYTGAVGNGNFVGWYKDNELIGNDQTDHYAVITTDKVTKLNITWDQNDQSIKSWWARTNKTNQEKPTKCVFKQIRPTPHGIDANRETEKLTANLASVRRVEKENVSFKCVLAPSSARASQVYWDFSKDGEKFNELPNGVRNGSKFEIVIDKVDRTHQGYYRCKLNKATFTAILRVKDRLAALWPFLGIVCTVIILVIGIFILERRQKIAKKNAAAEEEVIDPLVSSGNKLSDNENQKSNVIA